MRVIRTGWGNPCPSDAWPQHGTGSRPEFHYFGADGLSLCARWGVGHTRQLEEGRDDHPDNCPACVKKKREREAAECMEG
jgi:hypothetical protein